MADIPDTLPTYDQLPYKAENPAKTAWGLFGDEDQIGMFNLQTPERIAQAAQLIRKGAMFPMNWDQSLPSVRRCTTVGRFDTPSSDAPASGTTATTCWTTSTRSSRRSGTR